MHCPQSSTLSSFSSCLHVHVRSCMFLIKVEMFVTLYVREDGLSNFKMQILVAPTPPWFLVPFDFYEFISQRTILLFEISWGNHHSKKPLRARRFVQNVSHTNCYLKFLALFPFCQFHVWYKLIDMYACLFLRQGDKNNFKVWSKRTRKRQSVGVYRIRSNFNKFNICKYLQRILCDKCLGTLTM